MPGAVVSRAQWSARPASDCEEFSQSPIDPGVDPIVAYETGCVFLVEKLVMKALLVLSGAVLFLALMSGCEVSTGYGGAYGGVYVEYPTTYYGQYYSYPAYPYYGHSYYYRAPFDRDHYWDRD